MGTLGKITRRTFMVASVAILGGVAFGTYKYKQALPNPLLGGDEDNDFSSINPYLKIDASGVTVITPRAEMGQGIQSTLAMLVAEELDLDWQTIKTEHGPASNTYYNGALLQGLAPYPGYVHNDNARRIRGLTEIPAKFLGMQITGGSTSVPDGFDKMRSAGASARLTLIMAAAKVWGVDAKTLKTAEGYVLNPANDERLSYIELADKAAKIEAPAEPPLRDPSQWRYLGKSVPRIDIPAKSTGTARFGIDVRLPDMLYATVKMNPRLGGGLKTVDTAKAETMPGVQQIISFDEGVAVVADNTWRAFKAAGALEPEWGAAPYPPDDAEIFKVFEDSFTGDSNGVHDAEGDPEVVMADASEIIEAEYRVPYLAHATMEPMNATAQVKDGKVDIWLGTQLPTGVRDAIAELGFEPANISVHTELLGGGFGRRAEMDYAILATKIAMQTGGRPVKMTWTREEDMRHDTFRPGAIGRFRGVMDTDKPLAVDARIASPSIMASQAKRGGPPVMGADPLIAEGTAGQPDGIENFRVTAYAPDVQIPLGYWRSVGASYNGFFHESFMDEMAHSKGLDPLEMRLNMMREISPTGTKVIEKVKEMAGWAGTKHINGGGRGFAYTLSFGAHTAQIIDVTATEQGIRIDKVYCAVDVGTALDPRNIEAQIQSGIIFGLTAAMMGEVNFEAGEVRQSNFDSYQLMRINQVPEIAVVVLENNPVITGVGEPGTPPSMPALGNAIFAALGKRIREMPFNKHMMFV